jgi:hypothetical protein
MYGVIFGRVPTSSPGVRDGRTGNSHPTDAQDVERVNCGIVIGVTMSAEGGEYKVLSKAALTVLYLQLYN